jgi:CheY-like chemotaxis protein
MMPTESAPEPPPAKRDETVLLVEDHLAVRNVFRRTLDLAGYRVLEATDGEDALAVCEGSAGGVDVLITDVIMPRMGGQELARRLAVRYPGLKVLYVSGYADFEFESESALDAGRAFLAKPFASDILVNKVRELLEESPRQFR